MSFLEEDIRRYREAFPLERDVADRFLTLLLHPAAFDRTHLPGHITGSAFIVSSGFTHVLLVHHAKLKRWLQPGGHAEGDRDVRGVALREVHEETGILNPPFVTDSIFDLDIHPIPSRKDMPPHDHYDVRFLLLASRDLAIRVSEESIAVEWVDITELEERSQEPSLLRMRSKLDSFR